MNLLFLFYLCSMKKKTINEPIINIVLRYAEKTFTKEFLDSTSDSWYLDSVFWFEGEYKCTKAQRDEFSEKIQYQFERYYTKEYGKRDDYYYLKGIIDNANEMHKKLEEILKRGTLEGHGITLKSAMRKLNDISFSLGLVRSAVNRKYKFDK